VAAILEEAAATANEARVTTFSRAAAEKRLQMSRSDIFLRVAERTQDFVRCSLPAVDEWANQFSLQRRLPLSRALILLAVPVESWVVPPRQQYITSLIDFFQKKIAVSITRGPLARMKIGIITARIDLTEIGSERRASAEFLVHILQRNTQALALDAGLLPQTTVWSRLQRLNSININYRRDTGISGLYLGFPFLLNREKSRNSLRIMPLLLWPVVLEVGAGSLSATLARDDKREVCLSPALESLLGDATSKRWRETADRLLGSSAALSTREVMEAFASLARIRSITLEPLPTETESGNNELSCAAVLFHMAFAGQAIREDLLHLRRQDINVLQASSLNTLLRLQTTERDESPPKQLPEAERFFAVASDPSQERAVQRGRRAAGLLVEGPPGTGKSQTIVNMVTDAIGHHKTVLIVCQKLAALEVVNKRLLAAGLAKRAILVHDIDDRAHVIGQIREQVEALFADGGDTLRLRRQRESLAERIQMLEDELDRLHEAQYRVDEASGMNYQQIVGELICADARLPSLPDIPALRQKFFHLDKGSITRHEIRCTALAKSWRAARYEGSPFEKLRRFTADAHVTRAFSSALNALFELEKKRQEALCGRSSTFELDEDAANACATWLRENAVTFLNLKDLTRERLVHWIPLFDRRESKAVLPELESLASKLQSSAIDKYSPIFSPVACRTAEKELGDLVQLCQEHLQLRTFFSRLNPFRLVRAVNLKRFITSHTGFSGNDAERNTYIVELLEALRLELRLRPLRTRLSAIFRWLGLPEVQEDCCLELSSLIKDNTAGFREIQRLVQKIRQSPFADKMLKAAPGMKKPEILSVFSDFNAAIARQKSRRRSLGALQILNEWLGEELHALLRQAILDNSETPSCLDEMQRSLSELEAYQRFSMRIESLMINKQLDASDLELLAILRRHEIDLTSIPDEDMETAVSHIFWREAWLGWKQRMEDADPELLLTPQEVANKASALADADREIRILNQQLLAQELDKTALGSSREWQELTRLRGPRALRLREFFRRGTKIGLTKLVPVWLMNPDVASRILPLESGFFDVVIYDEASQMPIEYALPTLFRARTAIVSGDEKQMPPSSFFVGRVENDETDVFDGETPDESVDEAEQLLFEDTWNRREIKDCPDLLQLARDVLPKTILEVHYRSVYRELIAFSNAAFYHNQLSVPARHPESRIRDDKPVDMIRVDGLYQNQSNRDEAEKVVDWLADFWLKPHAYRPSIGIVTFNSKQADLIDDILEQRALSDANFRGVYAEERERKDDGEDMSLFVKNVENVQGDERDIILFSTTFGRNTAGSFRRNFGVLGQAGGERRLNVAVSRARQKVVLMTSMPIKEISDILDTHRAPAGPRDFLQIYLEYARLMSEDDFQSARSLLERLQPTGRRLEASFTDGDDRFRSVVAEYIRSLGWLPETPRREDVFALDFAIEHPTTGLFAIGIECDAPIHALLIHARAREIWRPSVLRRSVPHVHRVSSRGWYHDGDNERERLAKAISQAMNREEKA
jgi:primosomal replication protein N''